MLADVERLRQEWRNCLTDRYADGGAENRDVSLDFYPQKPAEDSSVDLN